MDVSALWRSTPSPFHNKRGCKISECVPTEQERCTSLQNTCNFTIATSTTSTLETLVALARLSSNSHRCNNMQHHYHVQQQHHTRIRQKMMSSKVSRNSLSSNFNGFNKGSTNSTQR